MKERIAIVGTGVAGLGCAWNLRDHCDLTLFEQDARPGGHTNTVIVDEAGSRVPIDTGFIVFNKVTYPNLCRLFAELDVPIKPSEMSFSVQHLPAGLEYNGMGLRKVFAQNETFSARASIASSEASKNSFASQTILQGTAARLPSQ